MSEAMSATSKLKVILGTMELGRGVLVEDAPVSSKVWDAYIVIHSETNTHMQCFDMLDGFMSRGWNELDTALM